MRIARCRWIAAAVLLASALFLAGCRGREEAPVAATKNERGFQEITSGDVNLQWKVDGANLQVVVRAPTQGWVGVGFGPTTMMKDANFIIGYVQDGQVVITDQFGTQLTAHASDESLGGKNDITAQAGSESDGNTEISFTIPLDSGDRYDKALVAGQTYPVLLAYGAEDDFEIRHDQKARSRVQIQL